MERDLKNILAEVLVFPYEQAVVDSLETACQKYVEDLTLGQFEDCVLHLCLDITAYELVQSVNTQTGRKFPNRVYRALAGYVVGEALSTVDDKDDKVMFAMALRNVIKVRDEQADGIIKKSIDPSYSSIVEEYWATNNTLSSLVGKGIVTSIFDKDTWADTELEIEKTYDDIKTLAKYYCRTVFEKKYSAIKQPENQDIYRFAYNVANEIASQDWMFASENPIKTIKALGLKSSAVALNTIKSRIINAVQIITDDIDSMSVYRRFLYVNDYPEVGNRHINPQNFAIAVFYELLYERLKAENYE